MHHAAVTSCVRLANASMWGRNRSAKDAARIRSPYLGRRLLLKYLDELLIVQVTGVQSAWCQGLRCGASQTSETACGAALGVFAVSMASRRMPSCFCLPSAIPSFCLCFSTYYLFPQESTAERNHGRDGNEGGFEQV